MVARDRDTRYNTGRMRISLYPTNQEEHPASKDIPGTVDLYYAILHYFPF
jgi:hypothetical protein